MPTPDTLAHDRYLIVQQIGRGGMGAVCTDACSDLYALAATLHQADRLYVNM